MSEFNFKITEDQKPGGGVYMVGNINEGSVGQVSGSRTLSIKQEDYPLVDLATLTKNNFFLKTTCNSSSNATVTPGTDCNVYNQYYGGAVSYSYSYSKGVGTITINETYRTARQVKYLYGEDSQSRTYASYNHKVYMSRTPLK